VLEILLCSSVPTQLVIGAVLTLAGVPPLTSTGGLSFAFVVTLSLADTFALVALMVLLARVHGESAVELWLGRRPLHKEMLVGALLIPVVLLIVAVLMGTMRAVAPWLHNVETNPLEQLASTSPIDAALLGFRSTPAVHEESARCSNA
jgi:hypothetical protein